MIDVHLLYVQLAVQCCGLTTFTECITHTNISGVIVGQEAIKFSGGGHINHSTPMEDVFQKVHENRDTHVHV